MNRHAVTVVLSAVLVSAALAHGADRVLGTMTVDGKPTPLKYGAVEMQQDPESPDVSWLVILLSDVKLAEGDRAPARLSELASAGDAKAVRVLWKESYDAVFAVPYHQALAESGKRAPERPSISLDRYDGERFEGSVESKMLGQSWFFQASVKAAIGRGGTLELEPPAEVEAQAADPGAVGDDPRSMKMALGRMGYEYTPEMFFHAVTDYEVDAVRLFLRLGMAPNYVSTSETHVLIQAVTLCQRDAERSRDVVRALLEAGADVNCKDMNKSTPLIWAAQACDVDMVRLLVESGADVNARAAGGATPLMMAKVLGKEEMVELLVAAGATEPTPVD